MNTVGQHGEQQTAPARQIAGAVGSRVGKSMVYVFMALMVFVFLCAAPLWIGVAWWGVGDSNVGSAPLMPVYAASSVPTTDLGYRTEAEARSDCLEPGIVEPIYRSSNVVGYGCVVSLD